MSEQIDGGAEHETDHGVDHEVPLTGHDAVDGVLRSLDGLDDKPVDEHVEVFESAHETLRAALADAGDRPSGPTGS